MAGFLTRCQHCALAMLRTADIAVCTVWLCVLYPWGLADRPTGRQLISGYVGKAAHNNQRWGLRAARAIDWLALRFGDGPDHCRRAWLFYMCIDQETTHAG